LDEISIFRDSVMLEYQLIEKGGNIAKRNFFSFECFRSGLIIILFYCYPSNIVVLSLFWMAVILFLKPAYNKSKKQWDYLIT